MTAKKQKTSTNSTPNSSPRVMDIAKPGILKNSTATSRPVIVTNRVVIQDPMVVKTDADKPAAGGENPADLKEAEETSVAKTVKLVIKPLSAPAEADDPELASASKEGLLDLPFDADADGVVEESETKLTLSDPVVPVPAEPNQKVAVKPAAPGQDTVAVNNPAPAEPKTEPARLAERGQGDHGSPEIRTESITEEPGVEKADPKQEAETKAREEFEELIDNKTYFLPIDEARHRRSRIFALLGVILILVLALAWLDIALDSGIVELQGVQPVTHFFR